MLSSAATAAQAQIYRAQYPETTTSARRNAVAALRVSVAPMSLRRETDRAAIEELDSFIARQRLSPARSQEDDCGHCRSLQHCIRGPATPPPPKRDDDAFTARRTTLPYSPRSRAARRGASGYALSPLTAYSTHKRIEPPREHQARHTRKCAAERSVRH
jgi:hypothetical protein